MDFRRGKNGHRFTRMNADHEKTYWPNMFLDLIRVYPRKSVANIC